MIVMTGRPNGSREDSSTWKHALASTQLRTVASSKQHLLFLASRERIRTLAVRQQMQDNYKYSYGSVLKEHVLVRIIFLFAICIPEYPPAPEKGRRYPFFPRCMIPQEKHPAVAVDWNRVEKSEGYTY